MDDATWEDEQDIGALGSRYGAVTIGTWGYPRNIHTVRRLRLPGRVLSISSSQVVMVG